MLSSKCILFTIILFLTYFRINFGGSRNNSCPEKSVYIRIVLMIRLGEI